MHELFIHYLGTSQRADLIESVSLAIFAFGQLFLIRLMANEISHTVKKTVQLEEERPRRDSSVLSLIKSLSIAGMFIIFALLFAQLLIILAK